MADDQTTEGSGAESNSGTANTPGIPEPVIVEETIVGPAKKTEPAKPPVATPAPAAFASPIPKPPVQHITPVAPAPQTPPPLQAPNDPKRLGTDIAHILKDIKLPERSETTKTQKAEPAKAPRVFDTSLGSMADDAAPGIVSPAMPPQPAASSPDAMQARTPISDAPVAPAQNTDTKSGVVAFHTLKDDLQHVVRDQKISVVRAVSLEQDRKHRDAKAAGASPDTTLGQAQRSHRTLNILLSVVILLSLGGTALGGVYLIAQQRAGDAPAPQTASILFAESTVALPLSGKSSTDLKRILSSARTNSGSSLGSITRIVPTITAANPDGTAGSRAATLDEFLKSIASGAPDELFRAAGTEFFFGIHTVDKNAPVLVIPITSYDRAFAAMLAWEPMMNASLSPVFTPLSAQTLDANGLPTLRTFQDVIMRNYDARALKDDKGEVQLYYSFPTQNILVIAESPYSFAEVLSRLQAERRL